MLINIITQLKKDPLLVLTWWAVAPAIQTQSGQVPINACSVPTSWYYQYSCHDHIPTSWYYQDLVEQHQMGSNPDYGIPTPTLVSPPKVEIWPCVFKVLEVGWRGFLIKMMDWLEEYLRRCFRAPSMLGPTSTLASLLPTSRLPSSSNTHLTGDRWLLEFQYKMLTTLAC